MDKKDFDSIMDMAIESEIEAYCFYQDVAARVADVSLKKMFQELTDEEKGHQVALENIKAKEIHNFTFSRGADYKISETVALPKLSVNMSPVDAIALAMKKEEESMRMYTCLSEATSDPDKQKVFVALAKMEEGHKVKMEDVYNNTAFPEVW